MIKMIDMAMIKLEMAVRSFIKKENGDTNIVSMVVLIGIAVLLAIVFKDEISKLIKNLLETITGNAEDVVNNPA